MTEIAKEIRTTDVVQPTGDLIDISGPLLREKKANEACRQMDGASPCEENPEPQMMKDAVVLGTWPIEEIKNTPVTVLQAQSQRTPGNNWELGIGTVGQLLGHLTCHPVHESKDAGAFVFANSRRGRKVTDANGKTIQYGYRLKNKINAITAVAIDVDGTDKAKRVAERLYDLDYLSVVYTTHSHAAKKTPDGDRFRIVVFLNTPFEIPADPVARRQSIAEWEYRYAGFCELLGLEKFDPAGMRINQLMHTPRRASEDAEFEHYLVSGQLLDWENMPVCDDLSKYKKTGVGKPPSGGREVYDSDEPAVLSDGFDLREWWSDGGSNLLLDTLLDFIGWEVRGVSGGGQNILCPNDGAHSNPGDPDDQGTWACEGDSALIYCHHAHCLHLNTWDFIRLIEENIKDGLAVLPDGYNTLSALLCDQMLYPDEVVGEVLEFDPADYGVVETIKISFLGTPKKVEAAFNSVVGNDRAGDDHYAALYAGVEKVGNKTKAVEKLDELMRGHGSFTHNQRQKLGKRGSEMLKVERKAYALVQDEERRRHVEKAMDVTDPANMSMDPAEPLGDDLETALATLRFRFVIANVTGKFRIVRKPDLAAFGSELNSTIEVFTKTDFTDFYANQSICDGEDRVFPAKEFLELEKRKSALVFAPPPLMPGPNDYNMYQGRKLEAKPGDWPTLERFLCDIVCDGDPAKYDWLMLWMAHMVQRPGEKPGTGVIATGAGGIGKGTMGMLLMRLAAPHSMQIENEMHVVGQFAGEHLSKCILVVVNEALFGKSSKVSSTLKALFDSKTMSVEAKGMSVTTVTSFTRYYIDSNDAVPVLIENNGSERRYFVLRFNDEMQGEEDYFNEVHAAINGSEMQALLAYLEEYSPASAGLTWGHVRTAPETPERVEMGVKSLRAAPHRLLETLMQGEVTLPTPEGLQTFTANDNGFRVPQSLFRDYIAAAGYKSDNEDRDVPGIFKFLFPDTELKEGQGTVGLLTDIRWWEFPPEVIGATGPNDD